ncbi:sensor domain-containing diguanylate cyclase [Halomicronema hongdechloris]|uniref:sensor domain-containing diguanylate cyclase n=1 Tax=Halomicronema hongdechloris TaxID=1209493 RepID=UPI0016518169|nr:CHASE2 domain-containing protein [Halomicronema hongdechloris]
MTTGGLQPFTHLEYRLRFQLRGATAWDDRISLIAIDEASLAELGAFPWPRSHYAELLGRLQAAPPSVITFNLLFTDSAPGDGQLAAAMAQHQAIILATAWDQDGQPLDPVFPLAGAAMGSGHIYQPQAPDSLVRTILPQIQGQPALGIATAEALSLTESIVALPPLDRPLPVNWPGPVDTLSTVSFVDVLKGRVEASRFHGQIVLIGATATGLDQLSTPFDINPPASGVHLHGAVLDNILQQRWLQHLQAPWWLLLCLGPLLGLGLGRPWRQQRVLLGAGTLAWILLARVLMTHGWWITVVEPVLLLGLTAVTCGISQELRDDRRIRQYVASLWHTHAPALLLSPQESRAPSIADSASIEQLVTLADQLGRSQATQAAIARSLPMGLLAANIDGTVWFCNPLASAWLGVTTGETVASRLKTWLTAAQWQAVRQGEDISPQEIQDGDRWFALYLEPLRMDDSASAAGPMGFVLLLDDISYRKQMELDLRTLNYTLEEQVQQRTRQLESLNRDLRREVNERQRIQDRLVYEAHHDSLTQLPNRRLFLWHLQQRIVAGGQEFAVLFLDCDRFKLVNDTFGHWMGDELLKAVAAVLLGSVRPTDNDGSVAATTTTRLPIWSRLFIYSSSGG